MIHIYKVPGNTRKPLASVPGPATLREILEAANLQNVVAAIERGPSKGYNAKIFPAIPRGKYDAMLPRPGALAIGLGETVADGKNLYLSDMFAD